MAYAHRPPSAAASKAIDLWWQSDSPLVQIEILHQFLQQPSAIQVRVLNSVDTFLIHCSLKKKKKSNVQVSSDEHHLSVCMIELAAKHLV